MPIKPVLQKAKFVNGVSSYILPCTKIVLRYSNWGGSSAGLRQFIKSKNFEQFAKQNKSIEIHLKESHGHPVITGFYTNGRQKPICVKNMDIGTIGNKLEVLRTSSGNVLGKYKRAVESVNESARGIWSPMHVDPEARHKI